ncbi:MULTISPECIES: bifunctional phosphopantothenoylcysteine decarboxylase/phosphopantothenate--cysteine ligase CoaBC [unclassified Beijerinckia]|uniref:bifunctional phosphopantothenoylcysteine decarboxylase/phosphopantothenate--cysteine ligase CoaBC n=1 Tax=unclassified Beijerinckia TaxID=2638183 RepID=UPI0008944E7A|nr:MULTISPECIES: bifunctional phosphopantothenoylcysteine decarboxylase/phosphopantothenate--cysteine ligase CoaBC [unclassified Beijerinckia]MDH7797935.1 phosphopantothenoylcysteine decarboxylase/phosphopantothenate--cysteine ligase [Beijerinckia sp. GAS462]SED03357.1 Phosphopantothenate-cysteine ligase /Phosphopantothenoylcysteine decarboxylase [Beijerinckia sp. 28-YEA-48]
MLTGKRILLVIGGGIAAYKALDLIRRLRERGATVRAVLTPAASHFVTPLSVAALSGEKVSEDLFSLTDEAEMGHIELSRDADLLAVVPATADLIAKMANGLANDLASTLLLATDKKTIVAPAMNLRMWLHPATQRNVQRLREDGVAFVGPVDGAMACGEFGPGRMSEPLEIVAGIEEMLKQSTVIALPSGETSNALRGKHVVITSGPTHEPIDPVRYIANRSSGRQGHAIAAAAAAAGAKVTLISGPVSIPDPAGVHTVHVETAEQMLQATRQALPADLFIAAAAVADWRVATANDNKIKKGKEAPTLTFAENPDILATVAALTKGRPQLVVGFAAETEKVEDYARQKLARKKCDMIIANDVSPGTGVMGGDENTVHIVTTTGIETWPKMKKDEVAVKLVALLAQRLEARS